MSRQTAKQYKLSGLVLITKQPLESLLASWLGRVECHVKKSEQLRSLLGGGEGRVRRMSEGVDVELQLGLHENRRC